MAFLKLVSFWVGFLAFLWPKVAKNHGVSEIRVFLHAGIEQMFGFTM